MYDIDVTFSCYDRYTIIRHHTIYVMVNVFISVSNDIDTYLLSYCDNDWKYKYYTAGRERYG